MEGGGEKEGVKNVRSLGQGQCLLISEKQQGKWTALETDM